VLFLALSIGGITHMSQLIEAVPQVAHENGGLSKTAAASRMDCSQ